MADAMRGRILKERRSRKQPVLSEAGLDYFAAQSLPDDWIATLAGQAANLLSMRI
jgi:hypothetical protein